MTLNFLRKVKLILAKKKGNFFKQLCHDIATHEPHFAPTMSPSVISLKETLCDLLPSCFFCLLIPGYFFL